jgi:hypothetical protein
MCWCEGSGTLELLNASDHEVSEALPDAKWPDPFGVEIRYPSDRPETIPGDATCVATGRENAGGCKEGAGAVVADDRLGGLDPTGGFGVTDSRS